MIWRMLVLWFFFVCFFFTYLADMCCVTSPVLHDVSRFSSLPAAAELLSKVQLSSCLVGVAASESLRTLWEWVQQ